MMRFNVIKESARRLGASIDDEKAEESLLLLEGNVTRMHKKKGT